MFISVDFMHAQSKRCQKSEKSKHEFNNISLRCRPAKQATLEFIEYTSRPQQVKMFYI